MDNDRIGRLIAGASAVAECRDARVAWTRKTARALRKAQRAMDEKCGEAAGRLSEEAFERLFDEEQAKVDAFLTPMRRVADDDVWPREMHGRCI